ncbi:MAG: acetyl-CoA carboxylase biotin carboxyl carrier protein [Balneolaceae bacterium]|nr:MAG: acetyl-CoA carboxylase biotin carboxyl carrier protein [Balneolaceae bacterium]
MDLKLVKNILTLISESDVDEVSIEEGGFKIKIKKNSDKTVQTVQYQVPSMPELPQSKAAVGTPDVRTTEKSADKTDGEVIKSPIVGTFYEASSPESEPFVKEGAKVQKGDTLCIIEAMKIMNEIESEYSGTIQKILVNNASPVEFDQPLFIIKKD